MRADVRLAISHRRCRYCMEKSCACRETPVFMATPTLLMPICTVI